MNTPGCANNYQETNQVQNSNIHDNAPIKKALHSNVHDEDKSEPNCLKNHLDNNTPNEFSLQDVSKGETLICHSNVHDEDQAEPNCSKNHPESNTPNKLSLQNNYEEETLIFHSNVHDEDKSEPSCSKNHLEKDTPNDVSPHNTSEEKTLVFHSNAHDQDDRIQICSTSPQTSLGKEEEPPRRTGDKTSLPEPPEPKPPPEPSLNIKAQAEKSWVFEIRKSMKINKRSLPQQLLYVVDSTSGVIFIVDSGAEISLIPKSLTNGVDHYFRPKTQTITGIGNYQIYPVGSTDVCLKLGDLDEIKHTFWVTQEKIDYGIIGLDLLCPHQLVISPFTSKLTSNLTNRSADLYTADTLPASTFDAAQDENNHNDTISLEDQCTQMLDRYPELTEYPDYTKPVKHNHVLDIIVENFQPRLVKARKCNGAKRTAVVENFADLIQRGAMSRGIADMCASPITIVPKKDGSMRICVDYSFLNAHTRPLSYPLPRIDDLPEIVPGGTKFFSNLDLKEAYYSLPIHPSSRDYAAIVAHHGVFVPNRTTFGLKNAPMRFQQMMECILSPCAQFIFVYLDDILVFSSSENEHLEHLEKVFQTLSKHGLYLNRKKCVFAKSKVNFLGHSVGVDGIDILEEKVKAIKELPMPGNRKELKRFLGMVNYYFDHIPKLAETTKLLNEVSGGPKSTNRKPLKLNDAQILAYHKTIDALANAATLAFEHHGKPLIIYCDASDTHIGAVLEQEGNDGERRPLAFFSKSLSPLKRIRSTFYKELRALYVSIRHFQSRIIGRDLIIRTDSQSVEKAVNNPLGNQSPTEQRYIVAIKEYNPTVIHISGKDNQGADYMSRPPPSKVLYARSYYDDPDYICSSSSESEDSESENDVSEEEEQLITADSLNRTEIARLQKGERDLIDQAIKLGKTVEYEDPEGIAIIREEGNAKIILPTLLRLTAFEIAHGYIHLGKEKSVVATSKDYWWPTLAKDVEYWCKTCVDCQATKVTRYNRPRLGFFPEKNERFQYVHMDLVGPLRTTSEENRYILTAKDRGTGFLVTAPIKDKKAETVRNAFIQAWCGVFGVPQVVVTDNGKEFKNSVVATAFEQLGIDHHFVPVYSPSSNGFIERQHRTINVALRALNDETNWSLHLPLITAEINNAFLEGSPFTPSQYALGVCTNLSGRVLFNKVGNEKTEAGVFDTLRFLFSMSGISRNHKKHYNKSIYYEPDLFQCEKIWLKNPTKTHLSPLYSGPYPVLAASDCSMIIQKNGRAVKVPIKLVKGYYPREDLNANGEKQGRTHRYYLRERNITQKYNEENSESDTE